MAILMPTVDCKPSTPNVFLTPLFSNVGGTSIFLTGFGYDIPTYNTLTTFLRNEQLTNLVFPIGLRAGMSGKYFNVSLTQYKNCTVSSATPALVTITSHGYSTGDKVRFTASTAPTGMTRGIAYYVNVQSVNTFWIYDTYANAIAGGATGRVNTTGTGSSVVCHKVFEEKSYTLTDIYGNLVDNTVGSNPFAYFHSTGWTTSVTTTANLWTFLFSTDDVTITSASNILQTSSSTHIMGYGTTTQSATTDVDSFVFSKKIDMSEGFILKGFSLMTTHLVDPFLNPKFVVDPTQASFGNLRIRASSAVMAGSLSGISFGKNIKFTSSLANGATSATLTSNFDGVSGTYKVQLLSDGEYTDNPQVDMTFSNGSTTVTFSAISGDYNDFAVIAIPLSKSYTITMDDTSNAMFTQQSAVEISFTMVGEKYYKKTWSTLDTGITVGDTSLTTAQETGWQINDKIYIGGNVASGISLADETIYTISNITTAGGKDTITFTPTLATYNRAIKGAVGLHQATQDAIKLIRGSGSGATTHFNMACTFGSLVVANMGGEYMAVTYNANSYVVNSSSFSRRLYWLNCWSSYPAVFAGLNGTTIKNIFSRRNLGPASAEATYALVKYTYIQDICMIHHTSGISFVRQKCKYDNVRLEGKLGNGSQSSNINLLPNTSMKNVYIWVTNTLGNAFLGTMIQGIIENIYIDGAYRAIQPSSTVGTVIKNIYFGTIVANTYDISPPSNLAYFDLELNNIVGTYTFDSSLQKNLIAGSKIRITDYNGVTNANRILEAYGEITITGTGLADTTEHNGNPCVKFTQNSVIDYVDWEQTVPTGNIQNKDMMIGIWVNLNSANYWTGTHQMPRLTVTYDNGTIAYAEAAQVTGWQYIFVPFTPTTTFSSVKAKLTTQTDATGTNADVYFADYSVLYPAGYTLNLGAFDNFTSGLPTTPTISTSVSAQDVWAADPTQFGASTVGDKVNKIKKIVTGLQ